MPQSRALSRTEVRAFEQALSESPCFSRLGLDALRELRSHTQIHDLGLGQVIFTRDSTDEWEFFLLEGTVDLFGRQGLATSVTAGTPAATQALAPAQPRRVTARTRTPARIARVRRDLLQMLQSGNGDYVVQEVGPDDEDLGGRVLFQIYADYAADRLELPALPEIAVRIRTAVADERNGPREIARILSADLAFAARVTRAASSAAFGGMSPVRTLHEAVTRLGLTATRDLVVAFSMHSLFNATHLALRQALLDLWRHSSMVAAVSMTLARLVGGFGPEQALLAGLLHDIGSAVILQQANQHPDLAANPALLRTPRGSLQGEIGELVLRRWGFAEELVAVAREAHAWNRNPGPAPDLCDLVQVADLASAPGSGPPPEQIPALLKLAGGEAQAARLGEALRCAEQEIATTRALLLGT
jgi:HD-like signal output (HDOD) protein